MNAANRRILVLLAVLLVLGCLTTWSRSWGIDAIDAVPLPLGFMLLGAWLIGEVAARIGLPRVVGYLLFGVLAGPSFLPLVASIPAPITTSELDRLGPLDALAISLIALVAGGEIKVAFLRGMLGRISVLLLVQIGTILIGGAIVGLFVVQPMIPGVEGLATGASIHLALIIGLLCVANSPAIVVAMINETGAKGPLCDTALAATVCKDLVLVVLLTILLGFVPVAFAASDGADNTALVLDAAWHLIGSIVFGAVVGVAMHYAAERIEKRIDIFLVLGGFAIAFAANALHFAPLLVALVAGFTQANIWPERSERMFHSIERLLLPVYCVFFAHAGAGIDLEGLAALWPVALILVGGRLVLVWAGTTMGARFAGIDPGIRGWLWSAFTPQAGVAIALANEVANALAGQTFINDLVALLVASIALNEILGPLMMKFGLQRAGEIPAPKRA